MVDGLVSQIADEVVARVLPALAALVAEEDVILNVNQAAEFLHLQPSAVQRAVRRGDLPGQLVGKSYRLSRRALQARLGLEQPSPTTDARPLRSVS